MIPDDQPTDQPPNSFESIDNEIEKENLTKK